MKIKVYAPSNSNHEALDDNGFLELPEGSTLKDALKKIGVNALSARILLCRVNYEKSSLNRKLKDGDTVTFFTPLSGG